MVASTGVQALGTSGETLLFSDGTLMPEKTGGTVHFSYTDSAEERPYKVLPTVEASP